MELLLHKEVFNTNKEYTVLFEYDLFRTFTASPAKVQVEDE